MGDRLTTALLHSLLYRRPTMARFLVRQASTTYHHADIISDSEYWWWFEEAEKSGRVRFSSIQVTR